MNPRRRVRVDDAMTMVEVMIVAVILSVAIMGVLSSTGSLAQARTATIDRAQIQQIAMLMTERLQGSSWSDLTMNWAKPRFVGDVTTPPMTDTGTAANNLKTLGVLGQSSGVPDLKVYVEYYQTALMKQGYTTRAQWLAAMPGYKLPLGISTPGVLDVVFRVVITGREVGGQPLLRHEIFSARKN